MLLTIGCASKQITIEKKERIKHLTADLNLDNPREVAIAQKIYKDIMYNN
jgi:hypothetical protein